MAKPISVTWEVSTSNADEYDKDWKASAQDDLSDMGIKPKQQSQLTMKATLADKQYEDEMYISFYDVTVTGPVELIDKMKKWLRKEDMLGADESMKTKPAKKMIEAVRKGQNPKKVLEMAEGKSALKSESAEELTKKHRKLLIEVANMANENMSDNDKFVEAVDECIEQAINDAVDKFSKADIDIDDEDVFMLVHEAVANLALPPTPQS